MNEDASTDRPLEPNPGPDFGPPSKSPSGGAGTDGAGTDGAGTGARLLDYLRLLRAPNVFTAAADVTMGFLVVHQGLAPLPVFACLLAASCLIYLAGMVLNDVFDIEQDRQERPDRPLPSGRISMRTARSLGFGFLLAGVVLGCLAGVLPMGTEVLAWRSAAITGLLAACVLAYDGGLKRTFAGPLIMGGCRFFNVLLGMSVAAAATGDQVWGTFAAHQWLVAGGIGLYVTGLTLFARDEAAKSRATLLIPGTVLMMGGIGILGMLHRNLPDSMPTTLRGESYWWLLLGLLAFTILRRLSMAIADPSPRQIQWAVKHSILSLIMLDAAVALEVSHWSFALGIVALLIPTLILGLWVYST